MFVVCNAGKEFVNGWGICFLVVGAVFVGVVLFSLEVHAFHGVDSVLFVVFLYCLIDCHSVA